MAEPPEYWELAEGLSEVGREVVVAASTKPTKYVVLAGAATATAVILLAAIRAPGVAYWVVLLVFLAILAADNRVRSHRANSRTASRSEERASMSDP